MGCKDYILLATERRREPFTAGPITALLSSWPKLSVKSTRITGINTISEPFDVEHIYRGYRISIREESDGFHAKFWRVSGAPVNITARASREEGDGVCLQRAKAAVDKFIAYVGRHSDA